MNKKQLLQALEDYPDDTEIVLWVWTGEASKETHLALAGNNSPDTGRFALVDTGTRLQPERK